jgi:hypothetical protein
MFPLGIFFLVLIIDAIAVTGGTTWYFYRAAKKRIDYIERYTINFSITMAEGFAEACEEGYRKENFSDLRELFARSIREHTVDEAFFVRANGTIVAHSVAKQVKRVRGNIANDEFYYNLDLILRPVEKKSKKVQFTPYYMIERKIPFNRREQELIKKHLYESVDRNGWLVSKAVYHDGKPIGTVNFLISKDRVYSVIQGLYNRYIMFMQFGLLGVVLVSLFVSFIVFFRYRQIQRKAWLEGRRIGGYGREHEDGLVLQEEPIELDKGLIDSETDTMEQPYLWQDTEEEEERDEPVISISVLGEMDEEAVLDIEDRSVEAPAIRVPGGRKDRKTVVREAIPIVKKD